MCKSDKNKKSKPGSSNIITKHCRFTDKKKRYLIYLPQLLRYSSFYAVSAYVRPRSLGFRIIWSAHSRTYCSIDVRLYTVQKCARIGAPSLSWVLNYQVIASMHILLYRRPSLHIHRYTSKTRPDIKKRILVEVFFYYFGSEYMKKMEKIGLKFL